RPRQRCSVVVEVGESSRTIGRFAWRRVRHELRKCDSGRLFAWRGLTQPRVRHIILVPRIAFGVEFDDVVIDVAVIVHRQRTRNICGCRTYVLARKRVDLRFGFPGLHVNFPDRATSTRDVKMPVGQGGMKYRFYAEETGESKIVVSVVWLWLPVGGENPGGYGFIVFPIVTNDVPIFFAPGIRSAMCAAKPIPRVEATGIGAGLQHHVETVTID